MEFAIYGQIRPLVRIPRGFRFVDVDTQAWRLTGMHVPAFKLISVRENHICFCRVRHIFLNFQNYGR